jgi:serine/threonine protein kinase
MEENKEIPATTLDYYKIVKLIGKGAFGKVTLGIHKLTGKYVALKTINKAFIKDEFARKKVLQEVYIHKKLKHHHIIRFVKFFFLFSENC